MPGRVRGIPASFCQSQMSRATIDEGRCSQGKVLRCSLYHLNEIYGNVDRETACFPTAEHLGRISNRLSWDRSRSLSELLHFGRLRRTGPMKLELWAANVKGSKQLTIAVVTGSVLSSIADGSVKASFALLEPPRLARFLGGEAPLDVEEIRFRGASSPVTLRAVTLVLAIVKIGAKCHNVQQSRVTRDC